MGNPSVRVLRAHHVASAESFFSILISHSSHMSLTEPTFSRVLQLQARSPFVCCGPYLVIEKQSRALSLLFFATPQFLFGVHVHTSAVSCKESVLLVAEDEARAAL